MHTNTKIHPKLVDRWFAIPPSRFGSCGETTLEKHTQRISKLCFILDQNIMFDMFDNNLMRI